ncbi:MAG: hypothetical protein BZ138_07860 [Methanosphaera sp. rholeuAM270]|nr:MAG: hypothetical protein BZ138_07860 [Methanosphaera sp. rholeuAM270]
MTPKEGRSFRSSPIYDWMTEDVFLYFYKKNIMYSQVYNHQLWSGIELRVATPLHSEARRTFNKLRYLDPDFYERICEVFPDMYHADRYNAELVRKISFDEYEHSPKGLYKYIDDNYKGQQRDLAYSRIKTVIKRRFRKKIENPKDLFGSYPYLYLFEVLSAGRIKRAILPCTNITQKHFEFEGYTEKDYLNYTNARIESQNLKFS